MKEEATEQTELEAAEEAAQDSYGEMVDVLVENHLMTGHYGFNWADSSGLAAGSVWL